MQFKSNRLRIGGLLAAIVMALTAALLPASLGWVNAAREERQEVVDRIAALRTVLESLVDAETGERGYVITGKEAFLQPYHAALAALPAQMTTLQRRYAADEADKRHLVDELLRKAQARVQQLTEIVERRGTGGFELAEPLVTSGHGRADMDRVRQLVAELGAIEARDLAALDVALQAKIQRAIWLSLASTALNVLLLASLARMMASAIRAGDRATAQARETSEQLARGIESMQRRNDEISALGEMSRVLQAEMTPMEALEVTGLFARRLLPGTAGAMYLERGAGDVLELAAGWGQTDIVAATLEPSACWGLRRGQVHAHRGPGDLRCRHCREGDAHLCLPLMAYGEAMGLLHVQWPAAAGPAAEDRAPAIAMAQALSEQVALALSNARLRQVLRDQSIRDPLTGLYNRRYMEETLTRELARAARDGTPLALVVADLDHFKKINDTHGHPVGDAVLRMASQLFASMVRTGDVACRFGGEEFVLILPHCNRDDALQKAQQLCDALRALVLHEDGRPVRVTASFGVAATPGDGMDATTLVGAADRAVYEAKARGRDRVVPAGEMAAEPVAV